MGIEERSRGEGFAALWRELDEVRESRRWSRDRLTRRINALGGGRLSAKTLHDRMSKGRRVPWDQIRLVVLALELDEPAWRERWCRAERRRGEPAGQSSRWGSDDAVRPAGSLPYGPRA